MANFFVFQGQTFRASDYNEKSNRIKVVLPHGRAQYLTPEQFEEEYTGWQLGVSEETAKCLSYLTEKFSRLRNRPGIERERVSLAKSLGGRICERPAGNGVGSVYIDKSRPAVVYVQIGSNIKGRGKYALVAEFWTGNLIEKI